MVTTGPALTFKLSVISPKLLFFIFINDLGDFFSKNAFRRRHIYLTNLHISSWLERLRGLTVKKKPSFANILHG